MTKKECETALIKLWDNTFGTDCITGEDLDKYVDVIDGLIQYVFNPQPYKFEDLKVGIWVWDDVEHECRKILEAYVTDENDDVYVKGVPIVKHGLHKFSWSYSVFKEDRFYPIIKAVEYQK